MLKRCCWEEKYLAYSDLTNVEDAPVSALRQGRFNILLLLWGNKLEKFGNLLELSMISLTFKFSDLAARSSHLDGQFLSEPPIRLVRVAAS